MKDRDFSSLQKGIVALVVESIASLILLLLANLLPLPYLNYGIWFIAGFWIHRIHSNPLLAALALVLSVLGLAWSLLMAFNSSFLYANQEAVMAVQMGGRSYLILLAGYVVRKIFVRYIKKV